MISPIYERALNHPKLTREAERVLLTKYAKLRARYGAAHRKVIEVRNQVVRAFLRLVAKLGRRYTSLPQEDLLGHGVMGLIVAVERFEVERGFRFGTYAQNWIRHELQRACENLGTVVRVPVGEQLKMRRGTSGKWEGMQITQHGKFSLDAPLTADGEISLYDVLHEREAVTAESELGSFGTSLSVLRTMVAALDEREREILERRYLADEPETLDQVGKRLGGLSRERIRQVECIALKKMRDAFWRQGLTREAV